MAERVIDVFKPVEVQQQDREWSAISAVARRGVFDFLRHARTVSQTGQRIVMRHKEYFIIGCPAVRNVVNNGDQMAWPGVVAHDQSRGRDGSYAFGRRAQGKFGNN